jgi:transcription-repair coupling factor (superfamily II helicase)
VDLKIEAQYIPDMNQRLMVYRQMASARQEEELERELDEVRDRYGPPPSSVLNLADYGRIRIMADRLGVESLDREGQTVIVRFRQQARVDPERLVALVGRRGDLTLVPPAGLRVDLRAPVERAGRVARPASSAGRDGAGRQPAGPQPSGSRAAQGPAPRGRTVPSSMRPSWWTARAHEGEVRPGFTKAEILQTPAEDPRGEHGVFTRVGGLLSELLP